jgi:hypothetical protein
MPDTGPRDPDAGFICTEVGEQACEGTTHVTCVMAGEFLSSEREDCAAMGQICVRDLWCVLCRPGEVGCQDNNAVVCNEDGSAWELVEECDISMGFACRDGACVNLCDQALAEQSYMGCEFYAADLDNAAIAVGRDAASQQYAVVVSNPGREETLVTIERNDAPFGMPPVVTEVTSAVILPGDLEIFELPRREVDGSTPGGLNDGTHSNISSQAYRVRSVLPIIAYQFNPLSNFGVFSNDASLLLPTSAIGREYTVVGWPQTIADEPSRNPDYDFDVSGPGEDLRAFLTIVGTQPGTHVTLTLGYMGPRIAQVIGGGGIPDMDDFETFEIDIGPFDVLNFETKGLNADFTGSRISASQPVTVFVGSEASDVPRFETYATRQCCADHLEEQLFPDQVAGQTFFIARQYPRTVALNDAFIDPTTDSVGEVNEPEWVRVVAVTDNVQLHTTLPPPDDYPPVLNRGEHMLFRADRNFFLEVVDPDTRIHVLQAQASQEAVGIPPDYPGGDPAIMAVPPVEQYRDNYVILTPNLYGFDMITIIAPRVDSNGREVVVVLDDQPLMERRTPLGEPACVIQAADGIERREGDPPPDWLVYQCQISFPDVIGLPRPRVEDGEQDDGVHTIVSSEPVGVLVFGFDSFVSYGYVAGLNLDPLPM